MPKYRSIILNLSFALLSLTTVNTIASGTYSPGASGGNNYQMSKMIFYRKIACSNCPFAGRGKSADDAKVLILEISKKGDSSPLSAKERSFAVSYLQRRFKLKG